MCSRATAPSWHDEQTAAVGEMRRLSAGSAANGAVTTLEPWMPLVVGAAHVPVTAYEVPTWQVEQSLSRPGNTTLLKSLTEPPKPYTTRPLVRKPPLSAWPAWIPWTRRLKS